ncbi:hypothetical protein PG987_003446 [Apiospora arundinis]
MCECKVKTYKYTACLHRSKTRVLCWKASWRTSNFLCLGQVLTKCKPKKEKKERFGLCTKCTHQFLPYHINDPKYVRKYLKWKENNGYAGKRIHAELVPIEAIFTHASKRKHPQQSPMVAAGPRHQQSVDSFDLAAAGALSSDYYDSSHSNVSPEGPVDLSDLTGRMSLGPLSFRGRPHTGAKMLDSYRGGSNETKVTLLSPCNESKLQRRVRLHAAPKKPRWRSSSPATDRDDARRRTYFVMASPSPASSTGYVSHVHSRSHTSIPVPPPQTVREIFMGCDEHGQERLTSCAACTEAYFRERGIPDEAYIRECNSAPPMVVRVHVMVDGFVS